MRRPQRIALLARSPRVLGAQQVDGAAVHLREEERPHRPAFGVVALGLRPRADEHLLHDLFGEHTVAEDAASEREASSRRGAGTARPAPVDRGRRSPRRGRRRRRLAGRARRGPIGCSRDLFGAALGGRMSACAGFALDRSPAASSVTRLPSRMWTPKNAVRSVPRRATRPTAAIPTTGTGGWRPAGYVAPHWPRAVGSRRDADRAARDRRGAAGAAGAASAEPDRHRLGRPDPARRRHRGAAATLAAGHPRRLRAVVPVVQRAGRGQRPRVAADARRPGRRRVRRERPEGVDDARARRRATASCSPAPNPTRTRTTASRTSSSTCSRRASRCGRSCR